MTRLRSQESPQSPGRIVRRNSAGAVTEDRFIVKPPASKRVTSDVVVPNYRLRSANGEIFNNSYSSLFTEYSADDNYSSVVANSGESHHWTNGGLLTTVVGPNHSNFALDTSSAAARAAVDAIKAVNKTEVDAAAFAGEWGQTRNLHKSVGLALIKFVTEGVDVRRKRDRYDKIPLFDEVGRPLLNREGKPIYRFAHTGGAVYGHGALRRPKNAADLYLAYRMGIVPLLSDLEGACKLLSRNRALRYTARGTDTVSGQTSSVMTVPDSGTNWQVSLFDTRVWTIRYGILYESTPAARAAARLGLSRPLTSAWNLIPWSFVVDWFFEVGSWLDAIQPSFASSTLCAWASTTETRIKTARVSQTHVVNPGPSQVSRSWSGDLVSTSIQKTRHPWNPTVPTRPNLGSGFNPSRSADFAALVLQRINTRIN